MPIVGDIELFAREARAPVAAITGTNGKSTVTTLVARMAEAAGKRVLAGGNLGRPALELLEEPVPELYVLELSSFQLDTTQSLRTAAATVLNVTPDHMDRYDTLAGLRGVEGADLRQLRRGDRQSRRSAGARDGTRRAHASSASVC